MMMISEIQRKVIENVNFIMKFPQNKGKFEEQLLQHYKSHQDDYETALALAFYRYCETAQFTYVETIYDNVAKEIMEIYTKLMNGSLEDWFLYSLKLLLYDQLPDNAQNRQGYEETLHKMFQIQEELPYLDPICIFTYFMQSKLLCKSGNIEKAIECLKKGILLCPNNQGLDWELWNHYYQPFARFRHYVLMQREIVLVDCLNQIEVEYFNSGNNNTYACSAFYGVKGNDLHPF